MKSGIEGIEQTTFCHATPDFYVVAVPHRRHRTLSRRQPPQSLGRLQRRNQHHLHRQKKQSREAADRWGAGTANAFFDGDPGI